MKYSILSAFILSLVLTAVGYAQADATTAAVDKIFSWSKPSEPGCSAAVMKDGKLVVERAYGSADLERNVPITNKTRFDAGSIRKQFVAAGILQLVEEGKLSLTDDIRKHIPELRDYGHKITLDHLLTHTSGIRDWQPLLNLAGGDPDAMTMILRQRELNFTPGGEWSYSNSGYVLLPEVIRRVSGMPFSEFAQKRIFEPLGMKNSVYADDPDTLIPHRALAYDIEKGSWKLDMYSGNDRGGAGALFTTAADLALWNDALMNGRLGAYVTQKLVEPTVLNNGRKLSYTRGLFVELKPGRGGQLVWHSGGAAGYSAVRDILQTTSSSSSLCATSTEDRRRSMRAASLRYIFRRKIPRTQPRMLSRSRPAT
jgi:CubicO group peptidase (beta-lactamase class C family)